MESVDTGHVAMYCFQGAGQWFELQDLHVQDLLPPMITLAEAYIQVSKINKCLYTPHLPCCIVDLGTKNRHY